MLDTRTHRGLDLRDSFKNSPYHLLKEETETREGQMGVCHFLTFHHPSCFLSRNPSSVAGVRAVFGARLIKCWNPPPHPSYPLPPLSYPLPPPTAPIRAFTVGHLLGSRDAVFVSDFLEHCLGNGLEGCTRKPNTPHRYPLTPPVHQTCSPISARGAFALTPKSKPTLKG